jgi:hypothetical protein
MGHRPENDSPESHEAKVSELGRAYAAAVLIGDEVAAEIVIREALEARLTSGEVDDEIIAPALWLVGELWERGEISVADEHIATEISIHEVQAQWPGARFVIGGRGLTSRVRSGPGIDVCRRVPEVVEAVDAMVKQAGMN